MSDYSEEDYKSIVLTKNEIDLIESSIWKEINQLERDAKDVHNNFGSYASESYYKKISELKNILEKF